MKIKRNGYLDREKLGIHLYARYMCVCCVMQYYEEVAEIKMYEVNCGRLFESVFLFRRIYFVPISMNVFVKMSVIFLKKKKKLFFAEIFHDSYYKLWNSPR